MHTLWKAGNTKTVAASPASIAYTAGYCQKKLSWKYDSEERIDYSTGEIYQWQPPFIQMSRRPGIAGHARQFVQSWRSFAVYNGQRQAVPRYLHEAWKAQASPEDAEKLAQEKATALRSRATTCWQLQAAEATAYSLQEVTAARRQLA